MSHSTPSTSLSLPARLFCYLGPPSAILLTYIASPKTALLSPLAFLPTAWLFTKWQASNKLNPSRRADLEPLIWTYATAGTLGLFLVMLLQLAICSAASNLLFGSGQARNDFWTEFGRGNIDGLTPREITRRVRLASSWQNWVFNGVLTFVVAGLGEETLKYLPIAYARRRGTAEQRKQRNRAYIDYAVAGALSFGLVEMIGFLYGACEQGREPWLKLMSTLLERMVGSLAHVLVAALTAMRAIRRDCCGDRMSWWSVVGPAVILHGTFDFVAMGASALEGNVGWIHPVGVETTTAMLGLIGAVITTAAWQVRQEWKTLGDYDRDGR